MSNELKKTYYFIVWKFEKKIGRTCGQDVRQFCIVRGQTDRTVRETPIILICVVLAMIILCGPAFSGALIISAKGEVVDELESTYFEGRPYVSIIEFADFFGLGLDWDMDTRKICVTDKSDTHKAQSTTLVNVLGDRTCIAESKIVTLERPTLSLNNEILISAGDGCLILEKLSGESIRWDEGKNRIVISENIYGRIKKERLAKIYSRLSREHQGRKAEKPAIPVRSIIIDAGHGGEDPGVVGKRGTMEKSITLEMAKNLSALVAGELKSPARLVRNSDEIMSIEKRVELINNSGSDVMVSLHVNTSTSYEKKGVELFIFSETTEDPEDEGLVARENEGKTNFRITQNRSSAVKSMALAEDLKKAIAEELGYEPEIKKGMFFLSGLTNVPSVVVEMGYISNSEEENNLKNLRYREKILLGIFKGIKRYIAR